MNLIKIALIIFLLLVFKSCYVVHKQTSSEFNCCFDGTKTDIEKSLNINGYYTITFSFSNKNGKIISKRTSVLVFYDNGICIQANSLDHFLRIIENDKFDSKSLNIGLYTFVNNSIVVRSIYVGSTTSGCFTTEYKILDANTIERVFYGNCDAYSKPYNVRYEVSLGKFIEYENLPDWNDIWLLNKKWFWCEEKDFKKWKNEINL